VKIWTSQNPKTAARQKTLVNSCPRSQQRKTEDQSLENVFELLTTRSIQAINDECHLSGNMTATKLRTYSESLEVCHPRCVVYNNVLTCRTLYLVNTTLFIYLCVIQHYVFRPSMWPSSGLSRN